MISHKLLAVRLSIDSVQRSLPTPMMDLPGTGQMLGLQGIHKALPEARHEAQQLLLPIPLQRCFHNPSAHNYQATSCACFEEFIGIAWRPTCFLEIGTILDNITLSS